MKPILTVLGVLFTSGLLVFSNKLLQNLPLSLVPNAYINNLLKYQMRVMIIAFIVMVITLVVTPGSIELLRLGDLEELATKERWLGINGRTSWKRNGLELLLFISLATAVFMFFVLKQKGSVFHFNWSFLPLILLLALSNSFAEEIIYRFAINGNLTGLVAKNTLFILSAILFGLPHFAGYPSGIPGVIMATILGYVLSKASYETSGLGLAWGIHFVQDVIIFTALFMLPTPIR